MSKPRIITTFTSADSANRPTMVRSPSVNMKALPAPLDPKIVKVQKQ
jgi:hypothetical protein